MDGCMDYERLYMQLCSRCCLFFEDLAKMGVMIRHYSNKELKGYVRVSVGKPEQTDALMDCINRLS
ncbi:putative histidinol-phosphate transaminase [Helianthus anomalus]